MIAAATKSRSEPLRERLLVVDPDRESFVDARVYELPHFLESGDVVVVNDAATLPGSLFGFAPGRRPIELRLLEVDPLTGLARAVLFGDGDHRTPTEHRPEPPALAIGDELQVGELHARVDELARRSPRELGLRFRERGGSLLAGIYVRGGPVQYAHVRDRLPLWAVQTPFASRPWAAEIPSAARPIGFEVVRALIDRGVVVRGLTHAAGLSSTGDPRIDAALPLPERWEIPARTADAIATARRLGKRIFAVGTSVTRALEGCAAAHAAVVAGEGVTDFVLGKATRLRVVSGIFTGMHDDATTSHAALLSAFAGPGVLARAFAHAERAGYLGHELGDSMLILPWKRREGGV